MDSISEASGGILNSCFVFVCGVLKSYWCQVCFCKVAIMYLSIQTMTLPASYNRVYLSE